jgi:hypothetical protein
MVSKTDSRFMVSVDGVSEYIIDHITSLRILPLLAHFPKLSDSNGWFFGNASGWILVLVIVACPHVHDKGKPPAFLNTTSRHKGVAKIFQHHFLSRTDQFSLFVYDQCTEASLYEIAGMIGLVSSLHLS